MLTYFVKKNTFWLILILGWVFVSFLPIFSFYASSGFAWHGVPYASPSYYDARLEEIKDGYPFIGNPYFFEHRNEIAPAFFFADWLAFVPVVLGFSVAAVSLVNQLAWPAIFLFLVYYLLKKFGLSKNASAIGSVLVASVAYELVVTPVSMQIIFPIYLFFLVTLWQWFNDPENQKKTALLVVATVISFYAYTYLWQIALVAFGLVFLLYIGTGRFALAWRIVKILSVIFIFSIPLGWYTVKQISHPSYWDSMERIGLVYTHLPTGAFFFAGRWILLMMVVWLMPLLLARNTRRDASYVRVTQFVVIIGSALLVTSGSNIVTGKELEIAQHIERFSIVWFGSMACVFVYRLRSTLTNFNPGTRFTKMLFGFGASVLVVGGVFFYTAAQIPFIESKTSIDPGVVANSTIAPIVQWLDSQARSPGVVWSNSETLDSLVPILSKHYVLFSNYGILHLLSSKEAEDRYLTYKYFDNLGISDLHQDLRLYAGSAHALHEAFTHNRAVKFCRLLASVTGNHDCGDLTDPITLKGEPYFSGLLDHYTKDIRPHIEQKLAEYHVTYIVKDSLGRPNFAPEKIKGTKEIYHDNRFTVYSLTPQP